VFSDFVLALLAANSLRHGHHGKLAVAASAAFCIPVTPGWFLTMPIGAWCLSVLYRQNVGFLLSTGRSPKDGGRKNRAVAAIAGARAGYSSATDDEPDEKKSEESEVEPTGSAVSAAAPIDAANTEQRGTDESPQASETIVAVQRRAGTALPVRAAKLSTLRKAWNEWWAGRHLWLTKAVQNILRLAFVLSFVLFISFSTQSTVVYPTPGGSGVRATFVSFGTPSPWFELSQNAGGITGHEFQWKILWYSSANVVMLLGLLAYWISFQIEKAKPDFKPHRFGSPTAVFSMVGAVAVLCIILGHFPLLLPEWKQKLTGNPRTPLVIAAENGNAENVKSLLTHGADPIQQLPQGFNSPLWWAFANGDSEIIDTLIAAQADVDFENSDGVTPLMVMVFPR